MANKKPVPKGFKQVSKSIASQSGFKPKKKGQTKKEAADAIAASAGRKNLGQAEMTKRSAAGRKKKGR